LFEKAFIEEYGLLQIFDRDLLAPGQSFNVSDIPYIAFYVQELTDAWERSSVIAKEDKSEVVVVSIEEFKLYTI